jgi:hypothetical protein
MGLVNTTFWILKCLEVQYMSVDIVCRDSVVMLGLSEFQLCLCVLENTQLRLNKWFSIILASEFCIEKFEHN